MMGASRAKVELLPLLAMEDVVLLPNMRATLAVPGDSQQSALRAARDGSNRLLVVPIHDGALATVGTLAVVHDIGELMSGIAVCVVTGEQRARFEESRAEVGGTTWVRADPVAITDPPTEAAQVLAREYRGILETLLELRGMTEALELVHGARTPEQLSDISGYFPDFSVEQRLQMLETLDIEKRLELLIGWMTEAVAEEHVKERIRHDVAEGMEKSHRDFILRQQMEAIRHELGDQDDGVTPLRERLAATAMPDSVRTALEHEISRLEQTSPQSPEHGWIRTYIEWMFDIPWSVRSEDRFDLQEARRILDEDHTALDDVKQRIIEFLAVRKLHSDRDVTDVRGRGTGTIITLIGPPGTGKTSLGESVARALGRRFARISLGGIRDEADIRGFRRTYVGAEPGRIARALKEVGTRNPVIMLDEIDKVGRDWRGDPSSALLEVLDPAQNHTFRDHYLEVDLDLSDVLFIPTGNVAETIPPALLDRMEIISLDGYTEDEKLAIARDHLLPQQLQHAGLRASEVDVAPDALARIVSDYTQEAGVRQLERELGRIARKVATRVAGAAFEGPALLTAENLSEYLGRPRRRNGVTRRALVPGVATVMAVTGTGGDVLSVEATATGTDGTLTVTGQLGDVMKESAAIALSFVRSHGRELGIPHAALRQSFHLHVPEGAVPKDGPSAGVGMVTALASLLTGRVTEPHLAMTGEVTLQGLVLPVGGIKQKILAAHRHGLTTVVIPAANRDDLDDLPATVRAELQVHLVESVEEALDLALQTHAIGVVKAG